MMMERNIPSTQQNYTIWCTYVSGRELDLIRAIDKIIANYREFGNFKSAELFEKLFGFTMEGAQIQEASE